MAKFTLTLFPVDERVVVTDGQYKGHKGFVRGWMHIGDRVAKDPDPPNADLAPGDVVHLVELVDDAGNPSVFTEEDVLVSTTPPKIEKRKTPVVKLDIPGSRLATAV
jgi:hypothetical protein